MTLREWREVLRRDPCAYCGGVAEHLDHITARSRGGKRQSDFLNLTAACGRCNSSKHAHALLTFLLRRSIDGERARLDAERAASDRLDYAGNRAHDCLFHHRPTGWRI